MKRLSVSMLLVLAAFSVSACGGTSGSSKTSDVPGDAGATELSAPRSDVDVSAPEAEVEVASPKPDIPVEAHPVPTLEAALAVVVDQVLATDEAVHPVVVYGLAEPLEPGVTVTDLLGSQDLVTERESWFFWIDDAPDARFGHDNRFVYVGVEDGVPLVTHHAFWPELDGAPLFQSGEDDGMVLVDTSTATGAMEQWSAPLDAGPVLPDAPYTPYSWEQTPCQGGKKPSYKALLIDGGGKDADVIKKDVEAMGNALAGIKQPGKEQPVWDVTKVSTYNDLDQYFGNQAGDCCDHFFLYFSAHGLRYVVLTDPAGNERICAVHQDGVVTCGDCVSVAKEKADWYLEEHGNDASSFDVVCPDPRKPANCMYCFKEGIQDHKVTPAEEADYHYLVQVGGESLTETYLESAIDMLQSCNVTVFMDTCFSGGMTSWLEKTGSVFQIFTSATSDRPAYYKKTPQGGSSTLETFLKCMDELKKKFAAADPLGGQNVQEELLMRAGDCLAKEDPYVTGGSVTTVDEAGKPVTVTAPVLNKHSSAVRSKPCRCCEGQMTPLPLPEGYCDGTSASCPKGQSCVQCACASPCGNGQLDAGETCDAELGCKAEAGEVCSSDCSVCMTCGNGKMEGDESCDPPEDACGGETCLSDCTCGTCDGNPFDCCYLNCYLGGTLACLDPCDTACAPFWDDPTLDPNCALACGVEANYQGDLSCEDLGLWGASCAAQCE